MVRCEIIYITQCAGERTPTSFLCYFFILIEPSTRIDVYEKNVYRGLWGRVVEGGSANIKTYPINAALLNISSAPLFVEWPPSVRPLNEMKSVGKCFIYRFASVAIMSSCVCVTPGPICFDISRGGGGPGTGDIFTTTAPPPTNCAKFICIYDGVSSWNTSCLLSFLVCGGGRPKWNKV